MGKVQIVKLENHLQKCVVKPKGNFDLCYGYDKVNTMMYIGPKSCMKASCDCIYEL